MTAVGPEHATRLLKENGMQSVWLVERPGESPRTVKTWPLTVAIAAKLLVGQAQPQRQIRGARRLASARVPTPPVAGTWRFARRGGRRVVELELEHVAGRSAFDLLRDPTVDMAVIARAATRLGHLVGAIATAGLLHRDLKLRNLIVNVEDPEPRVWVIDPVGVRPTIHRKLAYARMLERLSIEPRSEGVAIPRGVWQAVIRAALRSEPWRRVSFVLLRERLRAGSG